MATCPCNDSYRFNKLRNLLKKQIKWYEKNKNDHERIYDDSYLQFAFLTRGEFKKILETLSKES